MRREWILEFLRPDGSEGREHYQLTDYPPALGPVALCGAESMNTAMVRRGEPTPGRLCENCRKRAETVTMIEELGIAAELYCRMDREGRLPPFEGRSEVFMRHVPKILGLTIAESRA